MFDNYSSQRTDTNNEFYQNHPFQLIFDTVLSYIQEPTNQTVNVNTTNQSDDSVIILNDSDDGLPPLPEPLPEDEREEASPFVEGVDIQNTSSNESITTNMFNTINNYISGFGTSNVRSQTEANPISQLHPRMDNNNRRNQQVYQRLNRSRLSPLYPDPIDISEDRNDLLNLSDNDTSSNNSNNSNLFHQMEQQYLTIRENRTRSQGDIGDDQSDNSDIQIISESRRREDSDVQFVSESRNNRSRNRNRNRDRRRSFEAEIDDDLNRVRELDYTLDNDNNERNRNRNTSHRRNQRRLSSRAYFAWDANQDIISPENEIENDPILSSGDNSPIRENFGLNESRTHRLTRQNANLGQILSNSLPRQDINLGIEDEIDR
ncbi:hypothetical protein K502DRAFT_130933 [Neoconidiobolus thromboides FSU 785]|nr:hypothetical protein K502DRAFT_130933 [Neoconidiobolus thromboides FSU 785]